MDLVLHYFDEYVGDALYAKLDPSALFPSPAPSALGLAALRDDLYALNATAAVGAQHVLEAGKEAASHVAHAASEAGGAAHWVWTYLVEPLRTARTLPRESIIRQSISLYVLTYIGILILYFGMASFSYYYIFDHRMKHHPRFLKDQVRKEINFSLEAFPVIDILTLPWFLGDVRGWSQLYDTMAEGPFGNSAPWKQWAYMAASAVAFLLFTDWAIYWIHRWLHVPWLYKRLHKPHHKWIIPTPFASHAFHPVDGYLQSVPYHLSVYMFPVHKYLFIVLFVFVNLWSIFIHDSAIVSDSGWEDYINGPSHHTLHHLYFTCNYGQYFVWSDKLGGSFRKPESGDDPMREVQARMEEKLAIERAEEAERLKLKGQKAEGKKDR